MDENIKTFHTSPKTVFVGLDVLHLGVYDAVSHFNNGASNLVPRVITSLRCGITLVPAGHVARECFNYQGG